MDISSIVGKTISDINYTAGIYPDGFCDPYSVIIYFTDGSSLEISGNLNEGVSTTILLAKKE